LKREEKLVDTDVALHWFAAIASVVKNRARGLPSKLALRLAAAKSPAECQRLLEAEVDLVFAPFQKLDDRRGLVAGVEYTDCENDADEQTDGEHDVAVTN
jgi:hypothetical protein